jgi:hypothetical protein
MNGRAEVTAQIFNENAMQDSLPTAETEARLIQKSKPARICSLVPVCIGFGNIFMCVEEFEGTAILQYPLQNSS